jgi:hypothetical protein
MTAGQRDVTRPEVMIGGEQGGVTEILGTPRGIEPRLWRHCFEGLQCKAKWTDHGYSLQKTI